MLKFTEAFKLTDLEEGVWTPVIGDSAECGEQNFLVKPEAGKVSVVYFEENNPKVGGWWTSGKATVVHEEVFMLDERLAKYSLGTLTYQDFLLYIIENWEDDGSCTMVSDLIHTPELLKSVPNIEEWKKYVYMQDVTEEVKDLKIDGQSIYPSW